MLRPLPRQDFEAISPLSPAETTAVLSAMAEPFQWFGPWPLDKFFMGDVTQGSIYFSRGLKPYTWQPILSASISPHPNGTIISGSFIVRRTALYLAAAFILFLGASIAYSGSIVIGIPVFALFGISYFYERRKARTERQQIRSMLADALQIAEHRS